MRHAFFAFVLLFTLAGCKYCLRDSSTVSSGPALCQTSEAPNEAPRAAEAPETREIVVKAPRPKIVVEMPSPTVCKTQPSKPECQPPNAPAEQGCWPGNAAEHGPRAGRFMGLGMFSMPAGGMTPVAPAVAAGPMMGGMPPGGQGGMGGANMNLQGSMSMQNALAMVAALNNLTPQQLAMLLQLAGATSPSTFQMQMGAQLTPENIAAMRGSLGTPPGGAVASQQPAPTTPGSISPSPVPLPPGAGTSAVAALQRQLQEAEQRIRELERSRANP